MSPATPEIGDMDSTALVLDKSSTTGYEAIKPWIDCALAVVMLVVSAPIILLSLLLVRCTSRGPALYTQKRLGLAGKVFTIYKIRTMYQDSECHCGPRWCVPGDPRVTPVGRFLRRCHLDELPQLINILRGDMSLVGPRPERPEFLAHLERSLPSYRQRLNVRPGLTGLAQVQQPPDEDLLSVRRKLNYDLCYLERMNLWLDVRLILATALKCAGVPFVGTGRIFRLPLPDSEQGPDSLATDASLTSKLIAPENYVGLN
jgi:lipopolysaccharide/colanic/teichoic acid biosynthesis glycosyltransferase